MFAVRYMFCAIFTPNSVARFFKNTCLMWNWRSCNFTKNRLLQNCFLKKFTFTLKTFVITVKFPNLLKIYFPKLLWLLLTACQISYLKQMFVEINFCEINFRGIRGFLQFLKNVPAQIFFWFFSPRKINPWSWF